MKFLSGLLFFISLHAGATTYYIAPEGSAANSGRSDAEAWPAAMAYNVNLFPGDSLLFKRGGTYFTEVKPRRSGNKSGGYIYIGAYGKGAKPVITGFKKLADWVPLGKNIYESAAPAGDLNDCYMLLLDGRQTGHARYPNDTAVNARNQFLYADSVYRDSVLVSMQLPYALNVVGARVHYKSTSYTIDTCTVIARQPVADGGTRIFLEPAKLGRAMPVGYGFILSNLPAFLDVPGEYVYNAATKKIQVYLKDAPARHNIQAAVLDTLMNLYNRDSIVVDGLTFNGANRYGVFVYSAVSIIIKNCDITNTGDIAIKADGDHVQYITVDSNYIYNANNSGITKAGNDRNAFDTIFIRHNKIVRVGVWDIYAKDRNAIKTNRWREAGGTMIIGNRIDSIGSVGIHWNGSDVLIKNNYITNTALRSSDVGAVYSQGSPNRDTLWGKGKYRRRITHNVIAFGLGYAAGTTKKTSESHGIYLDDFNTNTEVDSNVVMDFPDACIFLHNTRKANVHDNTFFNGHDCVVQIFNDGIAGDGYPTRELTLLRNILFAKYPKSLTIRIRQYSQDSTKLRLLTAPIEATTPVNVQNFNHNASVRPLAQEGDIISTYTGAYAAPKVYNFTNKEFKAHYPFQQDYTESPVTFPGTTNPDDVVFIHFNPTGKDSTVTIAAKRIKLDGTRLPAGTTLTLKPFSAVILLRPDGGTPAAKP